MVALPMVPGVMPSESGAEVDAPVPKRRNGLVATFIRKWTTFSYLPVNRPVQGLDVTFRDLGGESIENKPLIKSTA